MSVFKLMRFLLRQYSVTTHGYSYVYEVYAIIYVTFEKEKFFFHKI